MRKSRAANITVGPYYLTHPVKGYPKEIRDFRQSVDLYRSHMLKPLVRMERSMLYVKGKWFNLLVTEALC